MGWGRREVVPSVDVFISCKCAQQRTALSGDDDGHDALALVPDDLNHGVLRAAVGTAFVGWEGLGGMDEVSGI